MDSRHYTMWARGGSALRSDGVSRHHDSHRAHREAIAHLRGVLLSKAAQDHAILTAVDPSVLTRRTLAEAAGEVFDDSG